VACFWAPLAPLRDDAVVATAIAEVFDAEDVEAAAAGLAQESLLVVDNCEHVLDEAARAVGTLLRATEKLRVIATSREPLALAGEHVIPVDPLERTDAVDLFVARAEAAGATALDAGAVAKLCQRLDDLPLAIALAAARTPALPPELLLERLVDRLDLLRGARDAEDRQRTLTATIGWSYDLLSNEEKRSFRNLSLFLGGASLEAVEEVAEAELDDLASLVAKSLVRVLSTPHGPRYWMLETIRDFAVARLAEGDAAPLEARLVRFFADLAARAEPELGDQDAVVWLERLEAEAGNLRLAFSLAAATDAAAAAVIGATLASLHIVHGRYAEASDVLATALEAARDPLVCARLNRLLGELEVRHDEFDAAAQAYAAGLRALGAPAARDAAWWRAWLDLKLREATLHYWQADSATLHVAAAALRPHVERHGTPRQKANFIETQVFDLLRRDRYVASAEAEELARAYVGAAEAAGDWDGHFMLGFVLLWRSKLDEAAHELRAARDDARTVGDVLTEMRSLVYAAIARRRLGDVDAVRDLDAEIRQFDEAYGYTGLIAANRAWLALRDRDLDAVERHGAAALADWPHGKRAGRTVFQWTARFPLLAVDVERQRPDAALEHVRAMLHESQQPLAPEVRAGLESGRLADAVTLSREHGYT
jgi:predicted ATPase